MTKVALIGCGNMGGAMLAGWLARTDFEFVVADRHFKSNNGRVTVSKTPDDRIADADMVVMAVKPQAMAETARDVVQLIADGAPVMSVAAGLTFQLLADMFGGQNRPIVRIMPNTPCRVGQGMTIAMAGDGCGDAVAHIAKTLTDALGKTIWIDDEALFDPMTTISGCGPAYVFYMIETLTRAGVNIGLDENDAALLARETVIGSAELAAKSDKSAQVLRENVTSKGGVTQAALDVLTDGRIEAIYTEALRAAVARSKELGGG